MDQGCADLTFGIQPQSLAIAHLLLGKVPDFADWDEDASRFDVEINTYPWYNHRERVICVQLYRSAAPDRHLFVVFGEDRRSDQLFVESWQSTGKGSSCWTHRVPTPDNTRAEVYEEAQCNRRMFDANEVGQVADYVFELMAEFYNPTLEVVS
jgi:hypothetical protein